MVLFWWMSNPIREWALRSSYDMCAIRNPYCAFTFVSWPNYSRTVQLDLHTSPRSDEIRNAWSGPTRTSSKAKFPAVFKKKTRSRMFHRTATRLSLLLRVLGRPQMLYLGDEVLGVDGLYASDCAMLPGVMSWQ